MGYFVKILKAEMRKQHKNRFFGKSIYVSLFIWPMLTFITAYYSYKPFPLDKIVGGLGYINESNLIIFVLMGYMCLIFFRCFVQSAWFFSMERTYGTLELVYLTPANRLAFIMGNASECTVSLFKGFRLFIYSAGRANGDIRRYQGARSGIPCMGKSCKCCISTDLYRRNAEENIHKGRRLFTNKGFCNRQYFYRLYHAVCDYYMP